MEPLHGSLNMCCFVHDVDEVKNMHVWTADEIYGLLYDVVPKNMAAKYLDLHKLDKPYTRYKKKEFAELVCETANRKQDLSDFITHRRDQKRAYLELRKIYRENYNTHPPGCKDWVVALRNYREIGTVSVLHSIDQIKTRFPANFGGIYEIKN